LKRALLSVWNKENIVELARFLIKNDFEIISTGGTKQILLDHNVNVTSISHVTKSEEIMNGRVKTLHPKIFGGILADHTNENHLKDLNSINSKIIDLVVVNLYPFEDMASNKNMGLNKLIEYIDVGGPSMLRAAAKNYKSVITLSNPSMYEDFMIEYSSSKGIINNKKRKEYARNVFLETSKYDSIIFNEFSKDNSDKLSDSLNINLSKDFDLRYGENPHQISSFYTDRSTSSFKQLSGKKLSYNNFFDIETSIRIVKDFKEKCCCIIKHSNPCGFSIGKNLVDCFESAVSCDSISYFGGIVGFNRKINTKIAKKLIEPFLECIVCPDIDNEALEILKMKKNLRVIIYNKNYDYSNVSVRSVMGGVLSQTLSNDNDLKDWNIVTNTEPLNKDLDALKLGWKIVKYVKSNAIVIANDKQIIGVGAGQMSRVDSVKIAIQKAIENGFELKNSILASDAFFPFSDSLELASKHGIKHFIQPGGSIKDKEIIKIADKLKVSMIFTNQRLFSH
jgi:phosphoribosylaminoimidazolecarboxamide formyltransferase / IMP cyclohydrolase